jgi:hypothetical protein
VINQYEQVQNQTKKSEISIENSKRVVLSDNNSSSTSTVVEKSREKLTESNGMVQNCERFSGKECTVDTDPSANATKAPKSSSSCSDLMIFCQSQGKAKPEMEQTTATVADFAIPYNIINNYFSGLYDFLFTSAKPLQTNFPRCLNSKFTAFVLFSLSFTHL